MIPVETKRQLLVKLLNLQLDGDTESAHGQADEVLLEILRHEGGYDAIIEAYEAIDKWYA